ncbi:MAG TPA: acyloxyacyl hydrolase [Fimbriimonadaceae bacterium]|nr:acyloxyacyl hydrolase [Fimbriimonadaceae bacterium]HRJ32820.1 acyloxyacyl hydrolase [Fimbriimonadaceae bacterium]
MVRVLGIFLSCAGGLSVASLGRARPTEGSSWSIYAGAVRSVPILGTSDERFGIVAGIQYLHRDPRFDYGQVPGYLVLEGYYLGTSGGIQPFPRDRANALGGLVMIRYVWEPKGRLPGTFFEFGWGLQYSDRTSRDLDAHWNSTPTLGGGFLLRLNQRTVTVGARLHHISNAGTKGGNRGQNQVHFFVGWSF